jgi:hypothetical protein
MYFHQMVIRQARITTQTSQAIATNESDQGCQSASKNWLPAVGGLGNRLWRDHNTSSI